jgi:hypothetical protein
MSDIIYLFIYYIIHNKTGLTQLQNYVSYGVRDRNLFFFGLFFNLIKRLTASPPEIDCNQTAVGLPPVTSAVFLIAKSFW